MRSSTRRSARPHVTALAASALAAALLLAGCSSGDGNGESGADRTTAAAAQEVFLQPVAAQGPDPFTASTSQATTPPTPTGTDPADTPAPTATARTINEITGSTPGLYGGTRSVASCDVEQQVAFLTRDRTKARAFAEAAGIPEAGLPDWLRGLTPVVLRVDTRVTNHGFRDGGATAFQSVLQAGTAVLVDPYGAPRVRCACGNPLRSPVAVQGATHKGRPWSGFHPDRVVVIRPTTTVVNSLVIVNVVNNTWIERKTGTDGEQDTRPVVIPPCEPDACDLTGTPTPVPSPSVTDGSPTTGGPTTPGGSTPPTSPESDISPPPSTPDCPSLPPATSPEDGTGTPDTTSPDVTSPSPSIPPGCPTPTWTEPTDPAEPPAPPAPEPPVESLPEPQPETESDVPSFEDLFPTDTAPQQPETFEG
ncbi:hypothetical protein Q5762_32775 [Streptomyces sp. P9(2023)]|uniref:DUF6777 domain-containing protein n=1 Tax=Streptomyces sp. P9(2023) TaxID=3064394 RepID=UPI0028F4284A|nr:DUF6777 domain-containing protein [Streptomyces sp. P9(2023)]MDT9693015.1 hypothetical protein [Streptomyces sp. P9(2023)]